ncbi:MAG TPA: amidohydrolase family protein [Acidimicrobiales bacterium]|nr:amidohydrolase family protein [Acidimicrobiales bacterium]
MTLTEGFRVVDADTHFVEPADLWTARAPKGYAERVPRIEKVGGKDTWVLDGAELGPVRAGGVIDRDGNKSAFVESFQWGLDEVHRAAWDPVTRLALMDECGVFAQVLYPSAIGIGGHRLASATDDAVLRNLCVELYNDGMAELQESSGCRFLPLAALPAWSIEDSVREAERAAGLGFRGVNMTTDPDETGSPDLANRAWGPLWEVCGDLHLPVHFHIASSLSQMDFYGKYFWASQHEYIKPAIGGSMLFLGSARVVINTIFAGIFERHPKLQMVAVESGIGWVPFILETMDYELVENAPVQAAEFAKPPSEYFRDHWYATFWFERANGNLQPLVDAVGDDRLLFETDFPHPTCLYPDPLGTIEEKMSTLRPESRRKILGDNAVALYRL